MAKLCPAGKAAAKKKFDVGNKWLNLGKAAAKKKYAKIFGHPNIVKAK